MALSEREKLDRIGSALYRKIMTMDDVADFKTWVDTITVLKIKNFIKNALQVVADESSEYSTEINDIISNI